MSAFHSVCRHSTAQHKASAYPSDSQQLPARALPQRHRHRQRRAPAPAAIASGSELTPNSRSPWNAATLCSKRSLLQSAGAALLLPVSGVAGSLLTAPAPALAAGLPSSAEQAAASCRGGVAAVSALTTGPSLATEQQLGSGIVWDRQGHIVTSYAPLTRVLRQSPTAQVLVALTAADGSAHQLPAAVVAKDPSRDIIVLQLDPPEAGLSPIPAAGTAARLRVGQDAYLLGALPGGTDQLVTAGVISAVGRAIPASNNQAIGGVLQTDAEVNAQSLGGALLDSSSRLVGMPVVSYSKAGAGRSSGVNFALSVDTLRDAVPKLIVYGSASARR